MTNTPARILLTLGAAAVLVAVAPPATAGEFRVLAWNVESNRPDSARVSDPEVIAGQLTELLRAPATRAQIVALSEVAPATIHAYRRAIAAGLDGEVDCVTSASGGFRDSDSLLLAVAADRFAIEQVVELHRHAGIAGNLAIDDADSDEHGRLRARSPLVARLRDRVDGRTFLFVAVHLARGEVALRTDQARMLRAWAADQREPIVAAGDFNFDWEFRTRKGNAAFAEMVKDDVWQWLEPDPLVDSNWADDKRKTDVRSDRYPDSILDFVFVAHGARDWRGHSDVVVRPGDFPDDDTTSDHRPIVATFTPPAP